MNMKITIPLISTLLFISIWVVLASCDLLGNDEKEKPESPIITSSDFTWQVDTVGNINTFLNDVAIIDADDIWVVGEIPQQDFGGGEQYNAMHWNGEEWLFIKVITESYSGNRRASTIQTVYIQTGNRIWFGAFHGGYTILDGNSWDINYLDEHQGSILNIGGDNSDTLFVSGNDGILIGFDGKSFYRIDNDLESDITALSYANDTLKFLSEFALRQYVDGQILPEFDPDAEAPFKLEGRYYDVWHSGKRWWYATEHGLYRFSPAKGYEQVEAREAAYLAGNAENDIIAVNELGEVYHWNGQEITHLETPFGASILPRVEGIAMKGDTVMIVGWLSQTLKGFILTGTRNGESNEKKMQN